jgi:hypothetical protein
LSVGAEATFDGLGHEVTDHLARDGSNGLILRRIGGRLRYAA